MNKQMSSTKQAFSCLMLIAMLIGAVGHSGTASAAEGYYLIDAGGGDCTLIGTWDGSTRTCTLTTDPDLTVMLQGADGVALDGAGHTVAGTVVISQSDGTRVENVVARSIVAVFSSSIEILNNHVQDAVADGIVINGVIGYTVAGNDILNAADSGIEVTSTGYGGTIAGNRILNAGWSGITFNNSADLVEGNVIEGFQQRDLEHVDSSVTFRQNNLINHNGANNVYVTGWTDFSGNYWSGYDTPDEGCLDTNADGVCDMPYHVADRYGDPDLPVYDETPYTRCDAWLPPTVDAGGPYTVFEGSTVNLSASGSDPSNDPLGYAWDLDGDGVYEAKGQNVVFDANAGPGVFSVAVEVSDPYGDTATDTTTVEVEPAGDTQPPVVSDFTIAPNPAPVGAAATITVQIDDSTTGGSAIVEAMIEIWSDSLGQGAIGFMAPADGAWDEAIETAVVTIPDWLEAGLYDVHAYGRDAAGNQSAWVYGGLLVMYDPNDGFVTGRATFTSPAGAYMPDPTLSGEAILGFVSKYRNGATVPSGHTSFEFETAGLSFYSDTYEWLVVAPAYRATFRGVGALNGTPGYRFTVWAIDGDLDGSGVDRVRIRIWNDDGLVYDNEIENGLQEDPATAILTGNIVIHRR